MFGAVLPICARSVVRFRNCMMHDDFDMRTGGPDGSLVEKTAAAENFALAVVTVIVAFNLLGYAVPALAGIFGEGSRPMAWGETVTVFLLTASIQCYQSRFAKGMRRFGLAISILAATWPAFELLRMLRAGGDLLVHGNVRDVITPQAAICFVLLGTAAALVETRGRVASAIADSLTFCMAFVIAIIVSGHLIGSFAFFGPVTDFITSGQTMLCVAVLAAVIFLRRSLSGGIFGILTGSGIGSKIARVLTPIMILLPYSREGLRAHLFSLRRMPTHYATAILATVAVAIAMALVMYLAWRMNELETEMQGLSLLDPLTGLHNLRGFRLLAEQALLMAHRSGQPFSVLYVDVDNLKQINDALGHQMGSDFLTDTAAILRAAFRETDVLGRIGGDEFAVGGQFSYEGIAESALRLRQMATERNLETARKVGLSFSVGFVTSNVGQRESLATLLSRADEEMYKEKRRRKALGGGKLGLPDRPLFVAGRTGEAAGFQEYGKH